MMNRVQAPAVSYIPFGQRPSFSGILPLPQTGGDEVQFAGKPGRARRGITAGVIALIVGLAAAGCGGGSGSQNNKPASPGGSNAPVATAPAKTTPTTPAPTTSPTTPPTTVKAADCGYTGADLSTYKSIADSYKSFFDNLGKALPAYGADQKTVDAFNAQVAKVNQRLATGDLGTLPDNLRQQLAAGQNVPVLSFGQIGVIKDYNTAVGTAFTVLQANPTATPPGVASASTLIDAIGNNRVNLIKFLIQCDANLRK